MIPVAVVPDAVALQNALPVVSLIRIYPLAAPVGIRKPSNSPVPVTSSVEFGIEFPIPILHPDWNKRDE